MGGRPEYYSQPAVYEFTRTHTHTNTHTHTQTQTHTQTHTHTQTNKQTNKLFSLQILYMRNICVQFISYMIYPIKKINFVQNLQ